MPLIAILLFSVGQLVAGGPLDELVQRDGAVVVAGRVGGKTPVFLLDAGTEFTLDVVRALKPEGAELPPTLELTALHWPIDLALPFEPGAEILATLFADSAAPQGFALAPHVRAIVPVSIDALPAEIPADRLASILAQNILHGAESVAHPVLRAGRIRLAAEALESGERDLLLPFAASGEPWVRRAAIGAQFRLGASPKDVEAAERDFRRFLATPQAEVVLPTGERMSPLHLFLESYGDVERVAVTKRDPEICALYLPLYRVIVDETNVVDPFGNERTFYRERIGLAGLAIAGTEDDLARLHAFTKSETPAVRQRAFDAIARILGLEPVPADQGEFASREPEIVAATTEALEARGVEIAAPKAAPKPDVALPKR